MMKLTMFIVTFALLQVSAATYGQEVTLVRKGISLERVFIEIRKQTGYDILFRNTHVKSAQPIDVNYHKMPLNEVLEQISVLHGLTYVIEGKAIIVKKATETPHLILAHVEVRGRVTDSLGQPLIGATVRVLDASGRRTALAATTDWEGVFLIRNVPEDALLEISFVGYIGRQMVARPEIGSVVLQSVPASLEEVEVMVSTGYQTLPKERATGSFEFIDNERLNKTISSNIIDRLELEVPGLLVDRSVGAPDKFLIRGRSSIFADVQPLIVLDGFPYDGEISNINPNDVESVTVLKDGAAASIWGARAGNGVIVISTKRATQAKPSIGFTTNFGVSEKLDLSTMSRISSADYIELEKFLFSKGHYATDEQNDEWNYGHAPFTPVIELLRKQRDGLLTQEAAFAEIEKLKKYDFRDEALRNLYRTAYRQQHSLNIGQRTERGSYLFSTGYDRSSHNLIGQGDSRINLRFNMDLDLFKWLKTDNSLSYVTSNTYLGDNQGYQLRGQAAYAYGGNKGAYPYARLRDDEGNPTVLYLDNNEAYVMAMQEKGLDWSYSPVDEIHRRRIENKVQEIVLNSAIILTPFSGFNVAFRYQFQDQVSDYPSYFLPESYYARSYSNSFAQEVDGKLEFPLPQQGILNESGGRKIAHQGRIQADWNKTWNETHQVNMIGGWEIRNAVTKSNSGRKYGYNEDFYGVDPYINYDMEYTLHNNSFSKQRIPSNTMIKKNTDNFLSMYFNGSYSYRGRYIATISARKDEANLFGVETNQKGTPLWSSGLKWNVSSEPFYAIPWLSDLSLRATYGRNGNISRQANARATITLTGGSYTTPLPSASMNGLPNKSLRWEKVNIWNFGVDFGVFNNRIQASVEYFDKLSNDLLAEAPMDPTLGRRLFYGNVASIHAKGIDTRIQARIIDRDFSWMTSIVFGASNPKVLDYYMPVGTTGSTYLYRVGNSINPVIGKPIFSTYAYKWEGLNPENGNPIGWVNGQASEDYVNISGKTSLDDLVYYGSAQPTRYGSFTNNFAYKSFDLSFTLSYKGGYSFRKTALSYANLFASWTGHGEYALRWQQPGDEIQTHVPSLQYPVSSNRDAFYQYAEVHVLKGDHIRLEQVRLNFLLPKVETKMLPFGNLSLFCMVRGSQLLWSHNKLGIDPYFNDTPRLGTQWSFGLNTSF